MRNDFNGLSEEQAEVLAILAEECAETIQVVGKILRHGLYSYNPNTPRGVDGPNNLESLERELGDVRAAIWLCRKYGVIPSTISDAAKKKMRIRKYLHHATTTGLD